MQSQLRSLIPKVTTIFNQQFICFSKCSVLSLGTAHAQGAAVLLPASNVIFERELAQE